MRLGQAARFARGEEWIVPRYEKYITGERLLGEERAALKRILARPERVRTGTFSASGTGTCRRRRQFQFLGAKQKKLSASTANIFINGDYMHLRHQAAGLIDGYLTDTEVSLSNDDLRLTGTADGVTSDGEFAEFKSMNTAAFSRLSSYGPEPAHIQQVNAYMFLGNFPSARIVYEDKNNQRLYEFHEIRNERIIDNIVSELEELNHLTDRKELAPILAECEIKEGQYRYCPFAFICMKAKAKDMPWPSQE